MTETEGSPYDVTITIDDHSFRAHSTVLSFHSHALFRLLHPVELPAPNRLDLSGQMKAEVFARLLDWMYASGGRAAMLRTLAAYSPLDAVQLYYAAKRLQMPEAQDQARNFLAPYLNFLDGDLLNNMTEADTLDSYCERVLSLLHGHQDMTAPPSRFAAGAPRSMPEGCLDRRPRLATAEHRPSGGATREIFLHSLQQAAADGGLLDGHTTTTSDPAAVDAPVPPVRSLQQRHRASDRRLSPADATIASLLAAASELESEEGGVALPLPHQRRRNHRLRRCPPDDHHQPTGDCVVVAQRSADSNRALLPTGDADSNGAGFPRACASPQRVGRLPPWLRPVPSAYPLDVTSFGRTIRQPGVTRHSIRSQLLLEEDEEQEQQEVEQQQGWGGEEGHQREETQLQQDERWLLCVGGFDTEGSSGGESRRAVGRRSFGLCLSEVIERRWRRLPPSPACCWDARACTVAAGRQVLITGGREPSTLTKMPLSDVSCWEWNGGWGELPPLTRPRFLHCAVTAGRYLYVIGGMDRRGRVSRSVERYSLARGQWRPAAPTQHQHMAAAVAPLDGRLWLFGGFHLDGALFRLSSKVEVYTPRANTWSEVLPEMPWPRALACAVLIRGQLHLAGGLVGDTLCLSRAVDAVDAFDAAEATWRRRCCLSWPRCDLFAFFLEPDLYVVGGRANVTCPNSTRIERLSLLDEAAHEWSHAGLPELPGREAGCAFAVLLRAPSGTEVPAGGAEVQMRASATRAKRKELEEEEVDSRAHRI